LYAVSIDALIDDRLTEADVAKTVQDLGEKGASDGLESDAEGRLYVTSYEQNAILRRRTDGVYETMVVDPHALWPDSLSLATDGFLYFTANQLDRQPRFHAGMDLRVKPYVLFRVRVDGTRLSDRGR
jgi:sugar lactone lactonase YvrE